LRTDTHQRYDTATDERATCEEAEMAVYLSDRLVRGNIYTRAELAEMLETRDATINTGIFQPRGYDSMLLFVT
jgi:hypothetical protein